MFKTVNLEISLKPFKRTEDEYIRGICKKVFEQWRPLLKNRKTVSVMLWTADGSEILDYSGDPGQEFEWCKYIGTANKELLGEDEDPDISLIRVTPQDGHYWDTKNGKLISTIKIAVAALTGNSMDGGVEGNLKP